MNGRNEFSRLGQWMIATGVAVGLVFPPFMLILGVPQDIALRPGVFAATVVCGIALGAFNLFLARWVVGRRIGALKDAMADLADDREVAELPCAENTDAFGEMARALAVFNDKTREKHALESRRAQDLSDAEAANAEEREGLAYEFDASVKASMEGAQKDTHALQDAARAMGESAEQSMQQAQSAVDLSQSASERVGAVAQAAENMAETVRALSERMRRSNAMSEDAVQRVHQAETQVAELGEATAGIESVAELINDIAEQTNMLALNATIEAARAGDAGKGFAVVASEVKNLANQTAKATEEITSHIQIIRVGGDRARVAMAAVTEAINEINAIAGEVNRATDEQSASIADISTNAGSTANETSRAVALIREVGDAIEQTGFAAHEMLATVDDLARQMGKLQQGADNFTAKVRKG